MDRMIYLGMVGAKQTAEAQGLLSNNLANVNTTGFRADLEHMRSVPVFGDGHPSRAAVRAADAAAASRKASVGKLPS